MTPTTLDPVVRLQAALDRLARALAAGQSEAVLSAEEPLAAAVGHVVALNRRDDIARSPELRQAIHSARLALARCRVLGQSASEFTRVALPQGPYGRTGLHIVTTAPSLRSRT